MQLTQLTCQGFRCLEDVVFCPGPGVNVIRGDNAQGKTSLLEALLYLTTSKSHRTTHDAELLQQGGEAFHVAARVQRARREVTLEANWWRGAKRFRINGVSQTRMSDILGKVNVVFFSPEDVELVRGSASHRRRFLDMELSQLRPEYLQALQQHRQVLRQRNSSLRMGETDAALLDIWDAQLVQTGKVLMAERRRFLSELDRCAVQAYATIAAGERLSVAYQPDVRQESELADVLRASRGSDLKLGVTNRGPHRDDIDVLIEGRSARTFASQGQQRTAALALKLAELALVHAHTGEYPILMLDDVLSELDEKRSTRLFQAIPADVQCLLTTTDLSARNGLFGGESRFFRIHGGRLERE